MRSYYDILEIPPTANGDDIKRAYRRLAALYHPDKPGGDTAKFQEIQAAYDTLSDPHKRTAYDRPAHANFTAHANPFDFDSFFGAFNAQYAQAGHRANRRTQIRLTLWLTIQDVFKGGRRPVSIGTSFGDIAAEIDIPAGIEDGEILQYPGIGPGGSDVSVTFRHHPSPVWRVEGANVFTEHTVTVWDCICGSTVAVRAIAGDSLTLTVPANCQPGTILRLKAQGLPRRREPGRGDLFVKIKARIPEVIPQELLDQIRAAQSVDNPPNYM